MNDMNLYDIKKQIAGFFMMSLASAMWVIAEVSMPDPAGGRVGAACLAVIAAGMILIPLTRGQPEVETSQDDARRAAFEDGFEVGYDAGVEDGPS